MKDFKKRLIDEEGALSAKINGLSNFIGKKDEFLRLSFLQQQLLREQLNSMVLYISVLRCRMVDLDIYNKK